jgi:uncharacterized protein (TIGR02145 family)
MKNIFYTALLLMSFNGIAQDIITKKSGEDIEAIVTEIGLEVVKYKKSSNLEGPSYTISKSDIFRIKYKNGEIEMFAKNIDKEVDENSIELSAEKEFIDERDGNSYKLVQIGNQIWMSENLRYNTTKSECVKDNGDCNSCGRYYLIEEAINCCPVGFHLPSDEEWKQLEIGVGMLTPEANKTGWRGTSPGQGIKLIEGGSSGLNIPICGSFFKAGRKYESKDLDETAMLWTSTKKSKSASFVRLFKNRASIARKLLNHEYKISVRCIKD